MAYAKNDFLTGMALRIFVEGLARKRGKKTPTAYSYNGVVLPKLPEWDRERFPYAVIMDMTATNAAFEYIVWFFDNPIVYRGAYLSYADGVNIGYAQSYIFNNGESGWALYREIADFNDDNALNGALVWANHNILDESGEVYFAKSEPTPVYE